MKGLLKSMLVLSVGINLYFIFASIQSKFAPDSDRQQFIHQTKADKDLKDMQPPVSEPVSSQLVSFPIPPQNPSIKMADCAVAETQVALEMQDVTVSIESEAHQQFRQDYLMEYEQQTEYAYTQIQQIFQNAEIKGMWDQSDQLELQRYTAFINPKIIEDLIIPFLNNSSNIDMQVPLDFNAFSNDG